jgi:synaptobrevin family protein YKT6
MITDTEYPYRPAFSLLTKLLDENAGLTASLPNASAAPSFSAASSAAFGGNPSTAAAGGISPAQKGKLEGTLASYLAKYQDPKQADTIMKVQQELDETKIVLVSGEYLNWIRRHRFLIYFTAQDHRVGSGAWREARQPRRAL